MATLDCGCSWGKEKWETICPKHMNSDDLLAKVQRLELQASEQQKKYSDLLQSHHSLCGKIEELKDWIRKSDHNHEKDHFWDDCALCLLNRSEKRKDEVDPVCTCGHPESEHPGFGSLSGCLACCGSQAANPCDKYEAR